MKVYCVLLLESPHRGDSNEHTHYTIIIIKKKITLDYPKSADIVWGQIRETVLKNEYAKHVGYKQFVIFHQN